VSFANLRYKLHCIFRKIVSDRTEIEVLNKCFWIITFNTFFSASAPFFFLIDIVLWVFKFFYLGSNPNVGGTNYDQFPLGSPHGYYGNALWVGPLDKALELF
jgi:hypothetical protein